MSLLRCSFCSRPEADVEHLVTAEYPPAVAPGITICNECAADVVGLMAAETKTALRAIAGEQEFPRPMGVVPKERA